MLWRMSATPGDRSTQVTALAYISFWGRVPLVWGKKGLMQNHSSLVLVLYSVLYIEQQAC